MKLFVKIKQVADFNAAVTEIFASGFTLSFTVEKITSTTTAGVYERFAVPGPGVVVKFER